MDKNKIDELIKNSRYYEENKDLLDTVSTMVSEKIEGLDSSITDNALLEKFLNRVIAKTFSSLVKDKSSLKLNFESSFIKKVEHIVPKQNRISKNTLKHLYQYLHEPENKDIEIIAKIFDLKYKKEYSIQEISEEIKISENEVIDKIFEIASIVNRIAKNELSKV